MLGNPGMLALTWQIYPGTHEARWAMATAFHHHLDLGGGARPQRADALWYHYLADHKSALLPAT